MDFSSLPEPEQQQLQKLQQQFQEHQHAQSAQQQQYQQYQGYTSQVYDPSLVQAYSQSYYSYYQYPQDPQHAQYQDSQQSQHSQQDQQQHYPYYQTNYQVDYSNAYPPNSQPHHQTLPESAPIYPPGVSVSQEAPPSSAYSGGLAASGSVGLGRVQAEVQHQQNSYHPQQVGPPGDQPKWVPPGLKPAAAAAVAALAQLTQFAGNMDAAERAMAGLQDRQLYGRGREYGPTMGPGPFPGPFVGTGAMPYGPGPMRPAVGQHSHRGSGRRGGSPFRGGNHRNSGNRSLRTGGSGPHFRGRGRGGGRGGPKRFPPHGASSSNPESSTGEVESQEEAEVSADNHEEVPAEASNQRPTRAAWCELCRVDCTSLEILEQHKNGKRHKKNLQKLEGVNPSVVERQNEQKTADGSIPNPTLQPENFQEGDQNNQNQPAKMITDNEENNTGSELQNDEAEQPQISGELQSKKQSGKHWMNRSDKQRHGLKRKMRGGRGGKRTKTFNEPRRPVEPPKPKVVIPLICDLCNVRCDTQEVFDRHLSGKKHMSKVRRFEGHQAMYGPMGLQALYPPNPITQSLLNPQAPQQAFYGTQGSCPPPGAYMTTQLQNAVPVAGGLGSEFQKNPNAPVPVATSAFGGANDVTEAQQQSASVGPESKQMKHVQVSAGNGVSSSAGTS